MIKTIDMQGMRYLNLFEKITSVRTRYFFKYNEIIMFCVPKKLLSKALSENNSNLKKMSDILKKRIRIIAMPRGIEDAKEFVQAVVAPLQFKDLEVIGEEVVLIGGINKAAFIGREKRRLFEMQEIIKDFFGKRFRVA
jgi:hypothetical protein